MTTPPNTSKPPSPFGGSTPPARPSPFSGSSPRPAPAPSSGLLSRLGARAAFEYMPLHDTLVMFDLVDVSKAIFMLLDRTPSVQVDGTPETDRSSSVIALLEKERHLADTLRERMLTPWTDMHLIGAVHVYDWREEVKQAATNRLQAIKAQPRFIRAADPLFVLNVLARARSYLLIPDAAVALDRPFLERILISDDTRLFKFAHDSGFTEDLLVQPPPPVDDVFDDEDDDK